MRESIGAALMTDLIITFIIIMLGVMVGALAYSKAYKTKNKIINLIEEYGDYSKLSGEVVDSKLKEIGYKTISNTKCDKITIDGIEYTNQNTKTNYCVYKIPTTKTSDEEGNYYYKVVTFMQLDIPIIGKLAAFPVKGETKVMYDTYINIE